VAQQATELVAAVAAPVVAALGLELFDVEITGTGRGPTLRVTIDRDGGIDLDAITAATEALSPVLDHDDAVATALPSSYLLEVSSPGLERTLRTPVHFRRAVGSVISLKTRRADGTGERRRAVLVSADDDGIDVDVDGSRARVGYADVVQARTVFEWGPEPKAHRSKKPATARTS
jgi:ribosome maturation factor RimP